MEFRIKDTDKGFIVEYKKPTTFGSKWVHITHYAGLPNSPFYYRTAIGAIEGALMDMEKEMYYKYHRM